jgi:hypothetical protein
MRSLFRATSFAVTLFLLGAGSAQSQPVFFLGQGGTHASIQAAIDDCPEAGCTIQLSDTLYLLPRELWIESKSNLTLAASPDLQRRGIRPRLVTSTNLFTLAGTAASPSDPQRPAGWKLWPNTCGTAVGGSRDGTNPYSRTGSLHNGLVVVRKSRDVRIEGLRIDGGSPSYFVNKGVWNCQYDVMFGNVGVNLSHSLRVTVRGNEFTNSFAAVHISNRHPAGLFGEPDSLETELGIRQATSVGTMGDHLVEENLFVRNWWAVYNESDWDLGSTFRFNRALDNRNTRFTQSTDSTSEASNMAGGFLYVKDVARTPHRIHNNTIWGSPLVIGHGWLKAGVQHLFYDNLVGGFDRLADEPKLAAMVRDGRQLLGSYSTWMDRNLFEVGAADSLYTIQEFTHGNLHDSIGCNAAGPPTGLSDCWTAWDAPVKLRTGFKSDWLWNGWTVRKGAPYTGLFQGVPYTDSSAQIIELFPGGGLIEKATGVAAKYGDVSAARNRWVRSLPFRSLDPSHSDVLEPAWDSAVVTRTVRGQGSLYRGWATDSIGSDLGAVQFHPFPRVLGLRSQLSLQPSGSLCWSFPVHLPAGVATGRIQGIKGWAVTHATPTVWKPARPPRALRLKALESTELAEGIPVKACFDSLPMADEDLRLHVEATGTLASGGKIPLEVAYFTYPHATSSLAIGTRSPRAPLSLMRDGSMLVLRGLSNIPAHLVLRSLDGRILRTVEATPVAGVLSTDLRGLPRGPLAVQVRQGSESRQELTTVF